MTAVPGPGVLVGWSWDRRDAHRVWTALATAGLVLAGLMAVFGLPPIDLHGPTHHLGIMMPSCGGTRAVRLAARGAWAASWRYNPVGIPVVLGGGLVVLRALVGLVTGRWLTIRAAVLTRHPRAAGMLAGALLAALEINQQAHAALLMTGR